MTKWVGRLFRSRNYWMLWLIFTCLLGALTPFEALGWQTNGTVTLTYFATKVSPPVYVVPPELKSRESLFRLSLQSVPESVLVNGALLFGGTDLGLTSSQSTNLNALLLSTYTHISADPAFTNVPSALPYCFAAQRQTNGQYFLYRPNQLPDKPECIVFLHGYGGNFQFYTWLLKEEFPNSVILAPSWGVSWHRGSATYLKDMLTDAEHRLGVSLPRPWLMAISAGGRGGFLVYNQDHAFFRGYICLASAPEYPTVLRKDLNVLMLNGKTDPMVPIGIARQQADIAHRRVPAFQFKEINGDHFFILSQRKDAFEEVREFMKKP